MGDSTVPATATPARETPSAVVPAPSRLSLVESAGKWIAVAGALVTAAIGVLNYGKSVAVATRELEWKQAEQARAMIDQLHDDDGWQAMEMLEWVGGYRFALPDGSVAKVTLDDVFAALDAALAPADGKEPDPVQREVVRHFDRVFFLVGRLQVAVRANYVRAQDVSFPLSWYVRERMCLRKDLFERYLKKNSPSETLAFFESLADWQCKPRS